MTLAPERPTAAPAAPAARRVNSRLSVVSATRRPQRPALKASGRPNPAAHLTPEDIEQIGVELDALREEIMSSRGAKDAAYIRKVIKTQRVLEMSSRAVLLFSAFPPAWVLGTAALSASKILENMEIGHNILHGQWDWMRDPKIHSTAWEWDHATPARQWKHSHNELHHTFTNVLGRDNDLGYGILRVDEDQPWTLFYLFQPVWHVANALIFEYGIAAYDLELAGYAAKRKRMSAEAKAKFHTDAREVLAKVRRHATRDYLIHPLLSLPTGSFLPTMGANLVANVVRNVWSNTVIICGHFPPGIATFEKASIEGETRGEWYLRQMLGSGNISGSKAMHIMTGNLSHQIEHHLFPDLPSNRYAEISPRIRDLMARYDLPYVTGSLAKQSAAVYWKVVQLSLPNKVEGQSRARVILDALRGKDKRGRVY
ncbi:MAG: fatty acid desaturase [Nostocoides sp.]